MQWLATLRASLSQRQVFCVSEVQSHSCETGSNIFVEKGGRISIPPYRRLGRRLASKPTRATIEVYRAFILKWFLNDGVPQSKIAGNRPFVSS